MPTSLLSDAHAAGTGLAVAKVAGFNGRTAEVLRQAETAVHARRPHSIRGLRSLQPQT